MPTRNEKVNIVIGAKDKTKGILSSVQSKIIGIGAAYMGWRAVTGILGSIIEAGKEHEKVWTDVAGALKRHGKVVDENLIKIQKFADEMQTLTGESDEYIGKSVQGFLDYGQSVDEAMKTTKVALDLAAGSGMELKSATELLSKAAVGYTSTLSRYGIIIDENIPKSEKFAAAIKQINERFGGAAQARADTYAVKVSLMTEKFGDLQEKLFKLFSPALLSGINAAVGALDSLMGTLDWLFPPTKQLYSATGELNASMATAAERADAWIESLLGIRQPLEDVSTAAQDAAIDIVAFAQTHEAVRQLEEMAEQVKQGLGLDSAAVKDLALDLSDLQFSTQDATAVIVDGLQLVGHAATQGALDLELTTEEIKAMFDAVGEGEEEERRISDQYQRCDREIGQNMDTCV